jgi:ATP phosphoribosyltransferase
LNEGFFVFYMINFDTENRHQIILPKGELEADVLALVGASGLAYRETEDGRLRVEDMNLDLISDRASSVPRRVTDQDARYVIGGITGSDILWENRLRREGLPLPVSSGAKFYFGATPYLVSETLEARGELPDVGDLAGTTVDTKFPNIAQDVLTEMGVGNVRIRYSPGQVEKQYQMYQNSRGIVEVMGSGDSAKKYGITVVEFINELRPVTVNLFEGRGLTKEQRRVTADFGAALFIGANNMLPRTRARSAVGVPARA